MESMTDTTPGIGKRCLSAFIGTLMIFSLGSLFIAPGQALAASSASPIVPGDTSSTDAVHQITVNADVNGNGKLTDPEDISETFTYDELKDMDLIDTTSVKGYLYKKRSDDGTSYDWCVAAAKNYVTMDDLLAAADQAVGGGQAERNALSVWNFGSLSQMTFDVMNPNPDSVSSADAYVCEPYTKCTFKSSFFTGQDQFFNNLQGNGEFFQGNESGFRVPATILAFDYKTTGLRDNERAETGLTRIKNDNDFENNTRFFMGISLDNVKKSGGDDSNMGRRFPSSVTQINIYPAGAPSTTAAE